MNFLSLEMGCAAETKRKIRESGRRRRRYSAYLFRRERRLKSGRREKVCVVVCVKREEIKKKENKIKEEPMQERHLEDMEENWKIWADVAVQMLGHCRWWMMF